MDHHDESQQLRLDHRHLAFFFVGAVAVCAIFFALGFVVGRGQTYEATMKEQSSGMMGPEAKPLVTPSPASAQEPREVTKMTPLGPAKPAMRRDPEADYRRELDFYNTLDQKDADENFHPSRQKEKKKAPAGEGANPNVRAAGPAANVPSGKLVSLQVGAFSNASDADTMSKTLRSKGYSISQVTPGKGSADKFIRIYLGPFTRLEEANKVKAQLEKDGYQAIVKR